MGKKMKTKKFIILSLFLVLLCCIIGAASAADDVSLDAVDASVDDAITVDAAIDDTDDSTIVEETPVDTISDDTAAEEIDEETQTDEISEESAIVDSEPTRASSVTVTNWSDLSSECTNPVLSINPDNPISQEISNFKTRNLLTSADLADNEYYIVNEEDVNIDDFQQTVENAHDQAPEEQDILIYLPSATFIDTFKIDTNLWNNHNYFFVSREKDKTIFDGRLEYIMGMTPGWDDDNTMTFINITFKSLPRVELSNHKGFE